MQRLKRAIKKIATIGVGAAMLGATITSAVALDLAEYPAPFIVNGEWDDSNAIVVGRNAAASDTYGVVDLIERSQLDSKKLVSSAGGELAVTGGVTEDIPIGRGIANKTSFALDWDLDDSDISSFQDTKISFQGSDLDVSDHITFYETSPSIETSLTSSEDDYEANVFMEATRGSIRYFYAFDDGVIPNNATSSEPLEIKFLGKTMKITHVESGGNEFTAYVGNEYFMKVGDSVTVDGKKVTLENVGIGGSIQIDVDGTIETIPAATVETVNGIEVANDETFYEDTKSERSANLIVGVDAEGTYKNEDPFIGEDDVKPNWKWIVSGIYIGGAASSTDINYSRSKSTPVECAGPCIGIKNHFQKTKDTDNPAGIGECYDLPNNYASVCLDSLTVADEDYIELLIEKTTADTTESNYVLGDNEAKVIHITASGGDETILIPGTGTATTNVTGDVKTDEVWLQVMLDGIGSNVMVYYYDNDKSRMRYKGNFTLNLGGNDGSYGFMRLNYGDTKDTNIWFNLSNSSGTAPQTGNALLAIMTLDINGDSPGTEITDSADNIYINWSIEQSGTTGYWKGLGATASSEEASELFWGTAASGANLGTKDEDHRTIYGIIIKDPKSNGASDQVVLEIPRDQVQANVVVKGQATTISGGSGTYIPVAINANKLFDDEVTSPTAHNLILVGGPCVNSVTASLSDLTCDGWPYDAGEALVKLVTNGDKVALIVAGTTASDTRMACKVLANYEDYSLETTEQIVTGTISAPTIKTA